MSDARVITADIIDPVGGPALSSVSDMPTIAAEPPPAPAPEPAAPAAPEPQADAADDDSGEPAAEASEGEPARQPNKVGRRLGELTRERDVERAKREAAEEYAARLERMLRERPLETAKPDPEPPAPEPPRAEPRPRRENFTDPDAYDTALDQWYMAQTERAVAIKIAEDKQHAKAEAERQAQERQREAAQTQAQQIESTYQERAAKFSEQHPDFAEKVEADGLQISVVMANAIKTNEDGPAVAYWLAEHPEEAARIASHNIPGMVFPPGHELAGRPVPDINRQLLEMGKLFASVSQPAAPAPRVEPPRAPPPVSPLRRSNAPATQRSMREVGDDPDGMAEYAAQRLPQLQAERRPGHRVN